MKRVTLKLFAVTCLTALASFGLLAQANDEKDLDQWMKTAGATIGSLRKNIEGKQAEAAAKDAATMGEVFKKTEHFWAARKKDDAVEWAKKAAAAAAEVEAAAKASDFEKAGAGLKGLFGNCAACHTAYRERLPDGSYRLKQ